MPILRLSQVIRRPVAVVFDAVVDVTNFPKWNPTTKSARKLDLSELGSGARFELEITWFGRTLQELQEFETNRHVRLVPHIQSIAGGHRFTFTTVEGGTRVDHELEMTPKGPGASRTRCRGTCSRRSRRPWRRVAARSTAGQRSLKPPPMVVYARAPPSSCPRRSRRATYRLGSFTRATWQTMSRSIPK